MRGIRIRWLRNPAMTTVTGTALVILATVGAPIASADTSTGGEPAGSGNVIAPMTSEQVEWRNRKLALIEQQQLYGSTKSGGVVLAPCEFDPCEPDPDPAPIPGAAFERKLDIRARHQYRYFFCGPATVQVLSNLRWNYFVTNLNQAGGNNTTANKYTQTYINNTWVGATASAGATIGNLIKGINQASNMPGFYAQTHNPTWAVFHNYVVANVWNWNVGAAAGVNPRKTDSPYFLTSWTAVEPDPDYGHYIALTGYTNPDNTSQSLIWYADSSGGKDQVSGEIILGSTGLFSDPSRTVYGAMMNRFGNLIN